jgi:hypothetical protein
MSYDAKVFNVMIASPGDVPEERKIAREVVLSWNTANAEINRKVLLPIAWETHSHPEMGDRPQGIINKQLLFRCDLLVAIFWTRLGTPTGSHNSGTVEEIEEHLRSGKLAMLYFSNAPLQPDKIDQTQYNQLKQFKHSCRDRGLFETFDSAEDFRYKFQRHLDLKLKEHAYFNNSQSTPNQERLPNQNSISPEASTLLREAVSSQSGRILVVSKHNGLMVECNGKKLIDGGGPRERAFWKSLLDELCGLGFIEDTTGKGQFFRVSQAGYKYSDLLRKDEM